jgi:hypothetical protein
MLPIALEIASKVNNLGSMKTSVNIPEKELRDLMKFSKAPTKKAAVVRAVEEFNQRQRMAEIIKYAGTFKDFMTPEDLRKMREDFNPKWSS